MSIVERGHDRLARSGRSYEQIPMVPELPRNLRSAPEVAPEMVVELARLGSTSASYPSTTELAVSLQTQRERRVRSRGCSNNFRKPHLASRRRMGCELRRCAHSTRAHRAEPNVSGSRSQCTPWRTQNAVQTSSLLHGGVSPWCHRTRVRLHRVQRARQGHEPRLTLYRWLSVRARALPAAQCFFNASISGLSPL